MTFLAAIELVEKRETFEEYADLLPLCQRHQKFIQIDFQATVGTPLERPLFGTFLLF